MPSQCSVSFVSFKSKFLLMRCQSIMNLTDLNISLGKDEQLVGTYSLSYSIVLFFIKSEFYVTNKRFIVRIPNIYFLVIPAGANTATYPLRNISAIRNRTRFKFLRLFLAAIFVVMGLSLLSEPIFGLILLVVGIVMGLNSFQSLINVETSSGSGLWYQIAFWEQATAQQLANDVNQAIVELT